MNKYLMLSLAVGLAIGGLYATVFLLIHKLQSQFSSAVKLYIVSGGFVLRLVIVAMAVRVAIATLNFSPVYVLAGFLMAHTAWLLFLTLSQRYSSTSSSTIAAVSRLL